MLLEHKVAVVYGGGGSIGGAVARAFTREGARVFLAGRSKGRFDRVADEIGSGQDHASQHRSSLYGSLLLAVAT